MPCSAWRSSLGRGSNSSTQSVVFGRLFGNQRLAFSEPARESRPLSLACLSPHRPPILCNSNEISDRGTEKWGSGCRGVEKRFLRETYRYEDLVSRICFPGIVVGWVQRLAINQVIQESPPGCTVIVGSRLKNEKWSREGPYKTLFWVLQRWRATLDIDSDKICG
jgi:hypothetical protein